MWEKSNCKGGNASTVFRLFPDMSVSVFAFDPFSFGKAFEVEGSGAGRDIAPCVRPSAIKPKWRGQGTQAETREIPR